MRSSATIYTIIFISYSVQILKYISNIELSTLFYSSGSVGTEKHGDTHELRWITTLSMTSNSSNNCYITATSTLIPLLPSCPLLPHAFAIFCSSLPFIFISLSSVQLQKLFKFENIQLFKDIYALLSFLAFSTIQLLGFMLGLCSFCFLHF